MDFQQVTLFTEHLNEQISFYCETLGFNCNNAPHSFKFNTGATEITFKKGKAGGEYHFTFLIPNNCLESVINFLEKRDIALIPLNNEKIIHFEDGRSIYFFDADGNILEFIERPDLDYESTGDFSISEIIKMNELGLVVEDPLLTSEQLMAQYHIKPYKSSLFSPVFCWVGDMNGAFIVVKKGRKWLPTEISAKSVHFKVDFLSETNKLSYII